MAMMAVLVGVTVLWGVVMVVVMTRMTILVVIVDDTG